ncbi:hypothetical protein DIPPA_19965 [Diplonema papillatum]|nr:hypothetical protein DIPPA_19965 [Diplonema papillatum]
MQDEHGNYKVVALGIGSGLAVVGWLALRDAETDEMRGLREGSLRELKVALASAVAADEASGKLPRAGTVLRNLADARELGMRADEDTATTIWRVALQCIFVG